MGAVAWSRRDGVLVPVRIGSGVGGVRYDSAFEEFVLVGGESPGGESPGGYQYTFLPEDFSFVSGNYNADGDAVIMLGTAIRFAVNGFVVGHQHYYGSDPGNGKPQSTNTWSQALWLNSGSGTTIQNYLGGATATVPGQDYVEFAPGGVDRWREAFYDPEYKIPVTTGVDYFTAYRMNVGTYMAVGGFFSSASHVRGDITAPATGGVTGGNGRYDYTSDFQRPDNTFGGGCYTAGVIFEPA